MKRMMQMTGTALILGCITVSLWGQEPAAQSTQSAQAPRAVPPARISTPDTRQGPITMQTFYLANVLLPTEANEFLTGLRNMLDPHDRIFLVPSQNAILVEAGPDDLALAQKILSGLDRPKKTYRLTYTVTETDAGKRVGTQHYSMIVVAGQRTQMKQGTKIPITTGSKTKDGETEFAYTDIGMSFDASLDEFANGVRLRSLVEQTSLADEKSISGVQEPVIRQSHLEGTAFLSPGKPMILGSLDSPGSTRHFDIEVVMEQVQ